jgi:hypothetical protein
LAKKAAEEEEKRRKDEEEKEKALQLLRGNQRTGDNAKFLKMKLDANTVVMDAAIENDPSEEQEDFLTIPLTNTVLDGYERKGTLAKRGDSFFDK